MSLLKQNIKLSDSIINRPRNVKTLWVVCESLREATIRRIEYIASQSISFAYSIRYPILKRTIEHHTTIIDDFIILVLVKIIIDNKLAIFNHLASTSHIAIVIAL